MLIPSVETLVDALRQGGLTATRELLQALDISQPTLSRLTRAAGWRVARVGAARRTRYAAAREVRTIGHTWPVYRVDASGRLTEGATLHALHPGVWWYDATPPPAWLTTEAADGVLPALPWFLDDLRPQGFLGRAFARKHAPELHLRPDPEQWDADAMLTALLAFGHDFPGNFVLGDRAAEQAQRTMLRKPEAVPAEERNARYEALAKAAVAGDVAAASAGGEQPKFAVCVRDRDGAYHRVLVKFSPPHRTTVGRRWADLLRCEHLAAETLRAHGHAAAESEWIEGPQRSFLEVARFDRVGAHGRRGTVSLLALDAAHYGAPDTWPDAADRLSRDGLLSMADAETLRVRWYFGQLIANTDLSFANISLMLDTARALPLAPSYDMLPMHYQPTATGEIVARPFDLPPPPPPRHHEAWCRAATMAVAFWERTASDPQVSAGFRAEAKRNVGLVQTLS